jgi:hypothetical protein
MTPSRSRPPSKAGTNSCSLQLRRSRLRAPVPKDLIDKHSAASADPRHVVSARGQRRKRAAARPRWPRSGSC